MQKRSGTHGQGFHQQGVVPTAVIEHFMRIVGAHNAKVGKVGEDGGWRMTDDRGLLCETSGLALPEGRLWRLS
ncbi:MAG: hypothetical protein JNN29_11240 [Chitinophagaceae bacterium]|nr:hypothetical protein [Chitinophagaceae bacterium]